MRECNSCMYYDHKNNWCGKRNTAMPAHGKCGIWRSDSNYEEEELPPLKCGDG